MQAGTRHRRARRAGIARQAMNHARHISQRRAADSGRWNRQFNAFARQLITRCQAILFRPQTAIFYPIRPAPAVLFFPGT